MDFLKALTMGQQLLDAFKILSQLLQANTEATEKHTAVAQQLLDAQNSASASIEDMASDIAAIRRNG